MYNKDLKKYLKEKSKESNPDLWEGIEKRLENKNRGIKFINGRKKNKKIYAKVMLTAAIIFIIALVQLNPGVELFDDEKNTEIEQSFKEPVLYSSLNLGDSDFGELNLQDNNYSENYGDSNNECSKEISEDILKDINLMCRGTVLNTYIKNYNYISYTDESTIEAEFNLQSSIYELRIDKIYYLEGDIKEGDIIKIEQDTFTPNSSVELSNNHQYILPLVNRENSKLLDIGNHIKGGINLEGEYCIRYPYTNEIEVANNCQYVFDDGWKSLIDENTVDVIFDSAIDKKKESLFKKQLKLRRDKKFEFDLVLLIEKYKNK